MTIKTWFLNKNFDANERIAIAGVEPTVERETEKAKLLKWNTEYGVITNWVPKSCIEENAEPNDKVAEMLKALQEREAKREEAFNNARGKKVKKIGGRKIFTINCDFVSYGKVWLDNGKKVDIHELELV